MMLRASSAFGWLKSCVLNCQSPIVWNKPLKIQIRFSRKYPDSCGENSDVSAAKRAAAKDFSGSNEAASDTRELLTASSSCANLAAARVEGIATPAA